MSWTDKYYDSQEAPKSLLPRKQGLGVVESLVPGPALPSTHVALKDSPSQFSHL